MAIIRPFSGSVKDYLEQFPAWAGIDPEEPCPSCGMCGCFIKHGTYQRWASDAETDTRMGIQRLRCKACGHTHAILPHFLHPYRHYILPLIQTVVQGYLIVGRSYRQLRQALALWNRADNGDHPSRTYSTGLAGQLPRRTLQRWLRDLAHGAALLFPALSRAILTLDPFTVLPGADQAPDHLQRVRDPTQRQRLIHAWRFLQAAEQLFAGSKAHQRGLHFAAADLLAFLLHWLSRLQRVPRLLWDPTLDTTPRQAF